jgi:hypothetical protein
MSFKLISHNDVQINASKVSNLWDVLHPWALRMVKHKAKVIMTLNTSKSPYLYGQVGSYTYSLELLRSGRDFTSLNKHKTNPRFKE